MRGMKIANLVGRIGETLAADFLRDKGYQLIEFNFRKNYTELDIIATYQNTTIFIEVKTRKNDAFGTPFEAITREKIANLVRTAHVYMKLHPKLPKAMRIDAIGITLDPDNRLEEIEHIENISGF